MKFTFFWGGPFSQWCKSPFKVGDVKYNCAEQYMMAEKARFFDAQEILKLIMRERHPRDQKAWGRTVPNFDAKKWEAVARDVVYEANWAKFCQNKGLEYELLSNDKILVEASPTDRIWGIGIDVLEAPDVEVENWKGTNWLGQVIMKVREDIKNNHTKSENINWEEQPWK